MNVLDPSTCVVRHHCSGPLNQVDLKPSTLGGAIDAYHLLPSQDAKQTFSEATSVDNLSGHPLGIGIAVLCMHALDGVPASPDLFLHIGNVLRTKSEQAEEIRKGYMTATSGLFSQLVTIRARPVRPRHPIDPTEPPRQHQFYLCKRNHHAVKEKVSGPTEIAYHVRDEKSCP